MNIYNNPYYSCTPSTTNPYVDMVLFKTATSEFAQKTQKAFLFDRASYVTGTIPYILGLEQSKPAKFYTQIMNEVEADPKKYNCTKKELQTAYGVTFEVLNAISSTYSKTRNVHEAVLKFGIVLLNDKFFEDASNDTINKAYFVAGIQAMSAHLKKLKSLIMK